MERIGVRELRQHASRYLAQVEAGGTVEVTDRGRLVARLVPVTCDPWQDLLAAGLLVEGTGDLLDVEAAASTVAASDVLAQLRADER